MKLQPRVYPLRLRFVLSIAVGVLLASLALNFVPSDVRYNVQEKYVITAGSEKADVYLAVLLPKSGPYQEVKNSQGTTVGKWQGQEAPSTDHVNVVANSTTLMAGETTEMLVSYDAIIKRGRISWVADIFPLHLAPETNIESDDPSVLAEAAKFIGNPPHKMARDVYSHVATYLTWPTGSRFNVQPSAVTALASRIGGCAEFANLTTALSRAAGVPAVTISGLSMPDMLPLTKAKAVWAHPAGAHAWVEMYTGSSWTLADPSWAGQSRQNAYFGRNDGKHLSFGPAEAEKEIYAKAIESAERYGTLIGAMSAPNKFIAAASSPGVEVTPHVTITKGVDSRHMAAVITLFLGLTFTWVMTGRL